MFSQAENAHFAMGQDMSSHMVTADTLPERSESVWTSMPYNRKYGWGGFPMGTGHLPAYYGFGGLVEADMLSVRGGRGRWNGTDTGNFKHGSHLLEGWNQEEDARLTMGIGINHKDIAWMQVFHPATEAGTHNGKYYGVTKIGSDLDHHGVDFMPSVAVALVPMALPVMRESPRVLEKDLEVLQTTEQVDKALVDKSKQAIVGSMYYDSNDNCLKVFTPDGWRSLAFETKFDVYLSDELDFEGTLDDGISLRRGTVGKHAATSDKDYVTRVSADNGRLPASICVRIGGDNVPADYDCTTGTLRIPRQYINGDIHIYRGVDIYLNGKLENPGSSLDPTQRLAIYADCFGRGYGRYHEEVRLSLKLVNGYHPTAVEVRVGAPDGRLLQSGSDYIYNVHWINDGDLTTIVIRKGIVEDSVYVIFR